MGDVRLSGVEKSFGDNIVLRPTNLHIADGEFAVLVGPSGSGKSTLLRLIAGLEEVSAGRIEIRGVDVTARGPSDRGIAMVFQSYALYPHLSVYENMAFALKLAKQDWAEIDRVVRAAAETLDITALLDRKPRQLSGGQRQRVAIGRAIVRQPKVFLFDEPLSNLDAALRVSMRYEFARLHEKLGTTMVYVTHDQVEAMTLADRIVVLAGGRIEQAGTPIELYEQPDNLFVASFIGSPKMNLILVHIAEAASGITRLMLPGGNDFEALVDSSRAQPGTDATLGLRPEHIRISDGEHGLAARVRFVEDLGALTYGYFEVQGVEGTVTVQSPGHQRLRAGETVRLTADPASAYLFDPDGMAFPRLRSPEQEQRRAVSL